MATDPLTYLPVVAWETKARKVRKISEWQYRISVSPDNINNKGAGKVEAEYCFIDNIGNQYSVVSKNAAGDVLLNDDFRCGRGPVPNRTGIIYKAVGDSRYLAQVMYSRLNNTAEDKGRAIDLAELWDHNKQINDTKEPLLELGCVNLIELNENKYEVGSIEDDGINKVKLTDIRTIDFIPLKESRRYTLSKEGDQNYSIIFYNAAGELVDSLLSVDWFDALFATGYMDGRGMLSSTETLNSI